MIDTLSLAIGFGVGVCTGLVVAYFVFKQQSRAQLETLRAQFAELSKQALKESKGEIAEITAERLNSQTALHEKLLESKKELIDQTLVTLREKIIEIDSAMQERDNKRLEQMSGLSSLIESLQKTSSTIAQALSNNKERGAWGERIAEDILQSIGLMEGIGYRKQQPNTTSTGKVSRPDFSIMMPNGLYVNMDVKFPMSNYQRYLEASTDNERQEASKAFIKDVRKRVDEVTSREYINENTVDCVLTFIPIEGVARFILEHDGELLEYALRQKVILCSPTTLFATLVIIRQAIHNFKLSKSTDEVIRLLGDFNKQWAEYKKKMEAVGNAIDNAQKAYAETVGVRTNQLEKPLRRLDAMIEEAGLQGELPPLEAGS